MFIYIHRIVTNEEKELIANTPDSSTLPNNDEKVIKKIDSFTNIKQNFNNWISNIIEKIINPLFHENSQLSLEIGIAGFINQKKEKFVPLIFKGQYFVANDYYISFGGIWDLKDCKKFLYFVLYVKYFIIKIHEQNDHNILATLCVDKYLTHLVNIWSSNNLLKRKQHSSNQFYLIIPTSQYTKLSGGIELQHNLTDSKKNIIICQFFFTYIKKDIIKLLNNLQYNVYKKNFTFYNWLNLLNRFLMINKLKYRSDSPNAISCSSQILVPIEIYISINCLLLIGGTISYKNNSHIENQNGVLVGFCIFLIIKSIAICFIINHKKEIIISFEFNFMMNLFNYLETNQKIFKVKSKTEHQTIPIKQSN